MFARLFTHLFLSSHKMGLKHPVLFLWCFVVANKIWLLLPGLVFLAWGPWRTGPTRPSPPPPPPLPFPASPSGPSSSFGLDGAEACSKWRDDAHRLLVVAGSLYGVGAGFASLIASISVSCAVPMATTTSSYFVLSTFFALATFGLQLSGLVVLIDDSLQRFCAPVAPLLFPYALLVASLLFLGLDLYVLVWMVSSSLEGTKSARERALEERIEKLM
jgi:hypothetical protein